MKDGALDDALKTERRLGIDFLTGDDRSVFVDEIAEQLAQLLDVRSTGPEDLRCGGIVEERQKKVFHRNEFVTLLASIHECHVQANFEFLRDHIGPLYNDILLLLYHLNCAPRPPVFADPRATTLPLRTAGDVDAFSRTPRPVPPWSRRRLSGTRHILPSPRDAPSTSLVLPVLGSLKRTSATRKRRNPSACSRR